MRAAPLLVSWHDDNAPIYSVHFEHHKNGRLATAGNDNNVRLWKVESIGQERKVTYLSTLQKHTQAVNVVRWCPRAEMLASAGDDGNVLLWVPSELGASHATAMGEDHSDDKEIWRVKHMCRSSGAEIYDLAWSPDGVFLITGSMDNIARIYNAQTGQMVSQIAEHSHYVQGVAWDPLNEFVATQSSDRSVHIYSLRTRDGQFTLNNHGKFSRMDMPPRKTASVHSLMSHPRPQSPTPALAELNTSIPKSSGAASPATSMPATPLPMDPPPLSHRDLYPHHRPLSRRSSLSSQHSYSIRRSASPVAAAMPLPAVKPMEPSHSPKIYPKDDNGVDSGGTSGTSLGAPVFGNLVRNANIYANETLTSFFRRLTFSPDGALLFTPAGQYKSSVPQDSGPPTISTTPSKIGRTESHDHHKAVEEIVNTVYIYTRSGLNKQPVAHLPGHKKPSIAVNCSPVLYELRRKDASKGDGKEHDVKTKYMTVDTGAVSAAASIAKPEAKSETAPQDANAVMPPPSSTASSHKDSTTNASASSPATGNEPSKPSASSPSNATSQNPVVPLTLPPPFPTPIFSLPYRIVYAVATQDTVLIYDTQQSSPLCVVSNLHFATFTDLAWSTDGSTLLLSSSDGFCSAVTFEKGELGTVYKGQTGVDFASPRKNEAKKSAAYAPNATITSSMPPTTIPLPSPSPASTILTATSTAATPATTSANSVSGPTPTMTSLPVTALDMSSGGCFAFSTPPDTPLNTTSQSSLFGQACSTFPGQLREGSAILGKRRISASKGAGGSQRSGQEQTASSAASPSAQQKSTESQPISSNVDKSQDGQQKAKKKRRIAPTPVNQP